MISVESTTKAADNAGAILFKCIRISGGHKRRYGRLGEVVYSISKTRRVYSGDLGDKILSKKVKKKRGTKKQPTTAHKRREKKLRRQKDTKVKSKKIEKDLYWTLLVGLKKPTNRRDGSYIKFDSNRSLTFLKPTTFGPANKSTMIPNFLGTRIFGPICREVKSTKWLSEKYKSIIKKSKAVV